jgi:hypothetical protein
VNDVTPMPEGLDRTADVRRHHRGTWRPPTRTRPTRSAAGTEGPLPEVTAVTLDQAPGILAAMADGTARGRSVIAF